MNESGEHTFHASVREVLRIDRDFIGEFFTANFDKALWGVISTRPHVPPLKGNQAGRQYAAEEVSAEEVICNLQSVVYLTGRRRGANAVAPAAFIIDFASVEREFAQVATVRPCGLVRRIVVRIHRLGAVWKRLSAKSCDFVKGAAKPVWE